MAAKKKKKSLSPEQKKKILLDQIETVPGYAEEKASYHAVREAHRAKQKEIDDLLDKDQELTIERKQIRKQIEIENIELAKLAKNRMKGK